MLVALSKSSRQAYRFSTIGIQRATIVTASELRSQFLGYFESKNHIIVPGSSVIPEDDPSLLFVNAGMNQFKKYYLGENIPKNRRLTTSQLCVRAGGKHNDLDNIGFTPRHQTMFEMLGNFSLGDYYKEEAIMMAYEFVHKILGIDQEYLRVSIHEKDETARSLWKKITGFRDDQIVTRGDKDNYWSMGSDDSPSGYCSEMFYTTDPSSTYDNWLEIWNIVFMNTKQNGGWIDTGMGCERMLSVLNHVESNFETDIFTPLIQSFHNQYPSISKNHLHIFADHLRTSVVLAGEVFPSSKGRGYVMRKIIRRLLRYAYNNGVTEPFLAGFVPDVLNLLDEQLPSLRDHEDRIKRILTNEEEYFWRAVTDGKKLFSTKLKKQLGVIPLSTLHQFHSDTGLPIDMLVTLLEENHIAYDHKAVNDWMNTDTTEGEGVGKKSAQFSGMNDLDNQQMIDNTSLYSLEPVSLSTTVLSTFPISSNKTCVVLKDCPFFPTQAGQKGDCGVLRMQDTSYTISNTIKVQSGVGCIVDSSFSIPPSTPVTCSVDMNRRRQIAIHHSATHLLHSILAEASFPQTQMQDRQSLQTGSHISEESFSFDFYAGFLSEQMKDTQAFIQSIEDQMNSLACSDIPIQRKDFSPAEIKALPKHSFVGDIARISRKDTVFHTVSIGDSSKEFCCGQHSSSTSSLYPFIITSIQSVSAGIKRIEAKAGPAAVSTLLKQQGVLRNVLSSCHSSEKEIVQKVTSLQSQLASATSLNTIMMNSVLENPQPSYMITGEKTVCVYEVNSEMPKQFMEKLLNKLKLNRDKQNSLILQNKSFSLLCQTDLTPEEVEKMKNLLFEIGDGGKGGGKQGIIKGVCNKSLIQCREALERGKW